MESLTGCEHTIIPDRIEAATLMIAAAITLGDVVLENINVDHMTAVVEKLREIGVSIESVGSAARVTVRRELRPADCIMLPYPGLPTDVQAQLMALLTIVPGISIVTDKVFPDRFMHAAELARMGASIRREGPSAIISGVPALSGASVMASDLRASAALVLAALAAHGDSVIRRIYHLDRGYDRLEHQAERPRRRHRPGSGHSPQHARQPVDQPRRNAPLRRRRPRAPRPQLAAAPRQPADPRAGTRVGRAFQPDGDADSIAQSGLTANTLAVRRRAVPAGYAVMVAETSFVSFASFVVPEFQNHESRENHEKRNHRDTESTEMKVRVPHP